MSDSINTNIWLKDTYGSTLDGRPKFRVVWSTNLLEKRFGVFRDFYGHILVREVKGVREVLKYPFYQDRWVLEKLDYVGDNHELIEKSTYEPLFVFQTAEGAFLPLNQRAVNFFMHFYNQRGKLLSPSDIEDEEMKKYEREVNYFKEYLDNESRSPYFGDLIV